jgi:hypothetical protein
MSRAATTAAVSSTTAGCAESKDCEDERCENKIAAIFST